MLTYFIFLVYLVFGIVLLHFYIRKKIFSFTIYHTAGIVLFKVAMGCLYGWIFLHYYGGDDTWDYFNESKKLTGVLIRNPLNFVQVFLPGNSLRATDYNSWNAIIYYVQHFERWFMEGSLAVCNLLSGKNYYINVILFEFATLPGPLLLFKLLAKAYPVRAGMNFILIFFVPSIIFWCSGIRAEGLLLLSMVLMIYNVQAYAQKPRAGRLPGILTGFLGILLIRYQMLAVFLPSWIAYAMSVFRKENSARYYNLVFITGLVVFAGSLFLHPSLQLSRPIQSAQEKFFALNGNTRYALDTLKPGPVSFLKLIPQAVANSTLRPYPWEGKNLLQSISSIEVLFLIGGICYFMSERKRRQQISHPIYWLFLYYAISQLILIGMVVPFPGAIVRYRTISLLMLLLLFYSAHPFLQQKLTYWIFKLH